MKRPDSRRLTLVALTIRVCPLLFAPARPSRRPPSEQEPSIRCPPKPPVNQDDRNRWVAPNGMVGGTEWDGGWHRMGWWVAPNGMVGGTEWDGGWHRMGWWVAPNGMLYG